MLPDSFEYVDLESVAGTDMISHRREEKLTAPSRAQRLASFGDIFYQTVRPYQKNNYFYELPDEDYVFSTGYAQLRPLCDGRFLFSSLQRDQFVSCVLEHCTGTSYPAINANDLAALFLAVPIDAEEQRLVGSILKPIDSLITLHQRKCQYRGLYGYLSWEQRKLGELGSVAMCKRIFKEQTAEQGDVPFYKIGTFGGTPDAFISRELFNEYQRLYQFPKVGDILISAAGTIGRTIVYQGDPAYYQDSNIVWLQHDERLDNGFLLQFLNGKSWSSLEGSTLKRLYNKDLLNAEIAIPSPDEQHQIGSTFARLDDTITLHQ